MHVHVHVHIDVRDVISIVLTRSRNSKCKKTSKFNIKSWILDVVFVTLRGVGVEAM